MNNSEEIPKSIDGALDSKDRNEQTPDAQEGSVAEDRKEFAEWLDINDEILEVLENKLGPLTPENFQEKTVSSGLLTEDEWDGVYTTALASREAVRAGRPEIAGMNGVRENPKVDPYTLAADKALLGRLKYKL